MSNNLEIFLSKEFDRAVELKEAFKVTESRKWSALEVIDELVVQVGHYAFIINNTEFSREDGRLINDRNDEISDILLQLCALCYKLDITKDKLKMYDFNFVSIQDSVTNLMSLIGQLTESIMELYGYRHQKERKGFDSINDFIIDRINRIFTIIFITEKKCDFISSFETMCDNAEKFLEDYKRGI